MSVGMYFCIYKCIYVYVKLGTERYTWNWMLKTCDDEKP